MAMSRARRRRRRPRSSAPPAYVFAALGYVVLLYLVNVRPGWRVLPFMTDAAQDAVGLLNLALAASLGANLVFAFYDPPRLRAGFTYLISVLGLAVAARFLGDFPFDYGLDGASWVQATRLLLEMIILLFMYRAAMAAVTVVKGRRVPRLAARNA
jgi:hypothetical protein